MPMQAVHFYAEVSQLDNLVAVRAFGSEEELAALMVCAICKSKKFRDAYKLTQHLLLEEGIYFETEGARKYGNPTE